MSSSPPRICYTRNGTQITDSAYQPCNSDRTRDSGCCGTNHSGAGHVGIANDVCDPNGLCQNYEAFDGTNEGVKLWWRQGCTDPTWESEECLKDVCNFARWQNENAPVRKCGDNSYCCGDKSCCGISSSLFVLAATLGAAAPSSTTLPAASSAATTARGLQTTTSGSPTIASSPTVASSSTAASSDSPETASQGLSTGAKAGIGAGIAVVVILLVIIAYLAMKIRRKKQSERKDLAAPPQALEAEKYQDNAQAYQRTPVELYEENAPVEIGENYPTELPGSTIGGGHPMELPSGKALRV